MREPLTPAQALLLNPLQLAFIGDSVYSLLARLHAIKRGGGVKSHHLKTTAKVNASAQASALETIYDLLDEQEREIVRRGRNAHARHVAPKSCTLAEYTASTGLEALFGYLYLTGQEERVQELFSQTDQI